MVFHRGSRVRSELYATAFTDGVRKATEAIGRAIDPIHRTNAVRNWTRGGDEVIQLKRYSYALLG